MAIKILVVDDAGFVRDTIKRTLRQLLPRGEILEAVDGRKALSMLTKNKVDLILSDWEMPEMTGHELLLWVRQKESMAKTPFIMITSRGDKQNVVDAVKAGVNDYISKPFTPEELTRKVAKQLKRLGVNLGSDPATNNTGFGSVDVLTGGATKTAVQKPRVVQEAAGFGKPAATKKMSARAAFKGKAQLRFANQPSALEVGVKELTLQALTGKILRASVLPSIFDQVAIDLENTKGEAVARLNGYVNALKASTPTPDAKTLDINVRFVDDDPAKLETLSLLLAGE